MLRKPQPDDAGWAALRIGGRRSGERSPSPHREARSGGRRAPGHFARLERFHEQMAGYLTQEQPERARQLLEEARRERP